MARLLHPQRASLPNQVLQRAIRIIHSYPRPTFLCKLSAKMQHKPSDGAEHGPEPRVDTSAPPPPKARRRSGYISDGAGSLASVPSLASLRGPLWPGMAHRSAGSATSRPTSPSSHRLWGAATLPDQDFTPFSAFGAPSARSMSGRIGLPTPPPLLAASLPGSPSSRLGRTSDQLWSLAAPAGTASVGEGGGATVAHSDTGSDRMRSLHLAASAMSHPLAPDGVTAGKNAAQRRGLHSRHRRTVGFSEPPPPPAQPSGTPRHVRFKHHSAIIPPERGGTVPAHPDTAAHSDASGGETEAEGAGGLSSDGAVMRGGRMSAAAAAAATARWAHIARGSSPSQLNPTAPRTVSFENAPSGVAGGRKRQRPDAWSSMPSTLARAMMQAVDSLGLSEGTVLSVGSKRRPQPGKWHPSRLPALRIGSAAWPQNAPQQALAQQVPGTAPAPAPTPTRAPRLWARVACRGRRGRCAVRVNAVVQGVTAAQWRQRCGRVLPAPLSGPCPLSRLACPFHTKHRVSRVMWSHLNSRLGGVLARPSPLPPPQAPGVTPPQLAAAAAYILQNAMQRAASHGATAALPPWWGWAHLLPPHALHLRPALPTACLAHTPPATLAPFLPHHASVLTCTEPPVVLPPLPLTILCAAEPRASHPTERAMHAATRPQPQPDWEDTHKPPPALDHSLVLDAWASDISSVDGTPGAGVGGPSPQPLPKRSAVTRSHRGLLVVPALPWGGMPFAHIVRQLGPAASPTGTTRQQSSADKLPEPGRSSAHPPTTHAPSASPEPNTSTAWTAAEQRNLEVCLHAVPTRPYGSANDRWRAIGQSLGGRSAAQVASRCQRFFKKLALAGLPVPGKAPAVAKTVTALRKARKGGWHLGTAVFGALHRVSFRDGGETRQPPQAPVAQTVHRHSADVQKVWSGGGAHPPDPWLAAAGILATVVLCGAAWGAGGTEHPPLPLPTGDAPPTLWDALVTAEAALRQCSALLKNGTVDSDDSPPAAAVEVSLRQNNLSAAAAASTAWALAQLALQDSRQ